jgi:hypothetical protein
VGWVKWSLASRTKLTSSRGSRLQPSVSSTIYKHSFHDYNFKTQIIYPTNQSLWIHILNELSLWRHNHFNKTKVKF